MTHVLILNRSALGKARYREWLGPDAGIRVIQNAASAGAPEHGDPYDEIATVGDYDESGLVEALALDMATRERFDRVLAFSEYDLLRAARLRERLGIPGQRVESARAFRDKLVMKRHLAEGGVAVPAFAAVEFATDLLDFAERQGFPVVVKPRAASGSRGVRVLGGPEELNAWLAGEFTDPAVRGGWMAEEFVAGTMFHVDGLLRGDETEICWPSETTSCLGFHHGAAILSHQLDAADPRTEPLRTFTRAALDALPHPELMTFHAEVWQRPDGETLVNEIAGRIGGGPIQKALARAFGVQLKERYVRAEAGADPGPAPSATPGPYAGYAILPTPRGTVEALPGEPFDHPWADARLAAGAEVGARFGGAESSVDEIGSCVVWGEDAARVRERLEAFRAWFDAGFRVRP
jgi:biotin carboxylase